MHTSIGISKITPPSLTSTMPRPSLTKLIKKGREKGVTMIIGQAAQGKTTLCALYVKELTVPAVWINLGKEDANPINLYYLLVHALGKVLSEEESLFLKSYPSVTLGPRLETPLFREWAGILFERLPHEMDIIFDGLDRLGLDAPAFQFLQILIEEAPDPIHFLLTSREEPSGIRDKKIKNAVHIINNADIAFTPAETRSYFKRIYGISLGKSALKKIHSLSEGWIGGLVLLSETVSRIPEKHREEYIEKNVSDYKTEVFKYFSEELLSDLSKPIKDIYMKAAIFDVIEPDLLNALIPTQNIETLFFETVKKNFFMEAFHDNTHGWMFRYHTMCREFLLDRLRSELPPPEQKELFFTAGELYEQRGDLENAVGYFLQASAYERVVPLIEKAGMGLVRSTRLNDLSDWLNSLPEDMVHSAPWLLFYRCMICRFTETRENIFRLEKARLLFESKGEINGEMLALAFIIEASIMAGRDIIPLTQLLQQGELLLNKRVSDQFLAEKATLMCQMGFGYSLRDGKLSKAYSASKNAYLLAKQSEDITLQVNAITIFLTASTFMGRLSEADKISADIDDLMKKCVHSEIKLFCSISQVQFYLVKGDFENAAEIIKTGKIKTERLGLIYLHFMFLLMELLLRVETEAYEAVEDISTLLLDLLSSQDNLLSKGIVYLFTGAGFYRKGSFVKAETYIHKAADILSSDKTHSRNHICAVHILQGWINCLQGRYETAENKLQKALKTSTEMPSYIGQAAVHFGMAEIKYQQNLTGQAKEHLTIGFKLAEKYNFNSIFWLSGRDFKNACLMAIELNIPKSLEYASRILISRFAKEAEPALVKLSRHPEKKTRELALDIRKKIHLSSVPEIQIRTFGDFTVLRGGKPMLDTDWERSQAKKMLKAIVSYGSQNVPKELIAEALWPESPSDVSENNFKVTLHRVRKSLEPEMNKTFGSSYLHMRNNLLSLDWKLCKVDVDQFEFFIQKGASEEKKGERKKSTDSYIQAVELYTGDYLVRDLYEEWAERKRRELKNRYIRTLLKLGRIFDGRGAVYKSISWYSKAIEADPLLEEACQRLMVLYSRKGKTNLAIQAYEKCRQALKEEIQVEPETLTKDIYKRIAKNTPKM